MISKDLYEHFCEIGYPYEGQIEGGFAMSEPIMTPSEEYGCNETFLNVDRLNISTEYAPSAEPPSTDARANSDGTYTVVDAKNDGDTNIYVVDENGERTGKIIGETTRAYDFLNTDDGEGTFTTPARVTIDPNNLKVSGTVNGTDQVIKDADRDALLKWGYLYFQFLVSEYYMSYISQGQEIILAYQSRNGGPLDLKVSLGLDKYTPILAGKRTDGKPKITTLRAVGNELFGYNLRKTIPIAFELGSPKTFYKINMKVIGGYNQHQNNGNGYNAGYPYFGEHTYSGSYIYMGYWGEFYDKK